MSFIYKSIAHIQLAAPAGSEDAARKFFTGILGLDEIEKPEELRKRGGVWFALAEYQIHIGIETPFSPAKKAHPAFEVENIDELKNHLVKNNVDVLDDDKLPEARRLYISDPFGNRIEFLEWKNFI